MEACGGGRLTYNAALSRTAQVIWQGMGANLPIYQLVTLWRSYKACAGSAGPLPWETESAVAAQRQRPLHAVGYIAVRASEIAALTLAVLSLLLPPNRGELTRAAYIQNYNYYMRLLDTSYRLTEEGTLQYYGVAGTVRVEISREGSTRFSFQEEDGVLTAVTVDFDYRYDPGSAGTAAYSAPDSGPVSLRETAFQTAFWAAAGAVTPLTRMEALSKQMETMAGSRYGFVWQDISVSFNCRSDGFRPIYEGNSIYSAEHPGAPGFVTARLTVRLPR